MNEVREHWGSRFGFVMAALGSAVGLGILWKFPYTVGENGGGLFLLTYLVCLLIVGVPLFISELILGRASQRAAVGAFEVLKPKRLGWRSAGWLGVLASFLIMSFYSVIAGYGMSYVLMSISGSFSGKSSAEVVAVYEELSSSGLISLGWHALFTFITVAVVLMGVRKGIERWSKLVTRALLLILFGLFLYGISLPGFGDAVRFIFGTGQSQFSWSSAIEALGLAFWTMSIGQGIMISYGSYMKKGTSVVQMGAIVAFGVIVVAILAALTIFPVVFSFDFRPEAGPGLIFQTLPFLFAQLPGSLLLSTIFFALFVFTALTSAIPLVEVVATNLMELWGIKRRRATWSVGIATFLFGIPSALAGSGQLFGDWAQIFGGNFLDTINGFVSVWVIPLSGLLTALFVGWQLDRKLCHAEFTDGTVMKWLYSPYRLFMRYVVPATIVLIILEKIK
ncbi:MAG: sodium-dependent transporter [Chlamydiales bacterium]